MGAPLGNQNRVKSKRWEDALARALARKGGSLSKGLDLVADQVIEKALNGEFSALVEIGNRMDGKPAQQQIMTGADGESLQIGPLVIRFPDDE